MSATPSIFCIISSTSATLAATFPPKPPKSPPLSEPRKINAISRRNACVLLSVIIGPLATSLRPLPAPAISFGISGPKAWLKEQKKKSFKILLAPIDASRNILRSAYLLLTKDELQYDEKDLQEIKKLVVSAARDCVAEERNSFVAFQAKTGVEVCTFRLVLKNAASLLDDKDPTKLEAEAKLTDVISSFASLSSMASAVDVQVASNRQTVANALKDTLFSLNSFEQGIKDCLEV